MHRTVLLGVALAALVAWPVRAEIKSLKVEQQKILINGKPAKLWGVRVASAAGQEEYTNDLLASLDFYKPKGVNALVVYYQGSTGQTYKAFSPDGKSFEDEQIRDRMRKIITAAGQKNMVVIVGLFFPRKMGQDGQDPKLASRDAYIEAARLAAGELKGFKNVIISLAHDPGRGNWSTSPIKLDQNEAIACLKAIAEVAPDLPRGCGGEEHVFNTAVAASDVATVILHSERPPKLPAFQQQKPVINICLLGKDSGGRGTQGVWQPIERDKFFDAIDKYQASEKDHLCVHFQGWHEGGLDLKKNRFIPGGEGVAKDPGTAWYFDRLDQKVHPPPVVEKPKDKPPTGESIFERKFR